MKHGMIGRVIIVAVVVGLCVGWGHSPDIVYAAQTRVRTELLHALKPRPQSTPNNTVYVERGIVSVATNTKIEFAGGNSDAFPVIGTAGNKRIDLLTLTSAGALNRVAGTEALAANAVPPAYPEDALVIAEITVDETGTVVVNDADIKDVRFFLNLGGGGGGSSQWTTSDSDIYYDTGNVGIGTTVPTHTLDVNGMGRIGGINIGGYGSSVSNAYISTEGSYLGFITDGGGDINIRAGSLTISNNLGLAAPALGAYIQGNVGIGTTGPVYKLDVQGGDVRVGTQTPGHASASPDIFIQGNLEVDATGYIDGGLLVAGNVGIGTTSPEAALDIMGGILGYMLPVTKAASATLTAAECRGQGITVTAAATITLPAVTVGSTVMIYSTGANVVSVDPNAVDRIVLDGTALDDGDKITSSGSAGDFIVLWSDSADGWRTLGRQGTWTDGGV